MSCWSSRNVFTAAVMSVLQISVALLCLLSLTSAALDTGTKVQIRKNVNELKKEKLDLAKRYHSSNDFISNVLDPGLNLVERMDDLMQEYDIEQEYPSVTKFVEDLKIFIVKTKIFTKQEMNKMAEEYEERENKIQTLLTKFLEGTDFRADEDDEF
ncbi:hypothetical protein NL108_016794 [Boleophthalmus pectinirostris]|nr:hypothetical protein NL108_016794 [Boleophthalmus pectinirostris]